MVVNVSFMFQDKLKDDEMIDDLSGKSVVDSILKQNMINQLKWEKYEVLDDGFVCLVDAMGDDHSIVEAARVSYGDGTKTVSDDTSLIRYLMRHRHTTPFEMVEFKFLVRVPMDCWRQWVRHRTASINEYSTRYSLAIDSAQTTPPTHWRQQSKSNKQGSDGNIDLHIGERLSQDEKNILEQSRSVYNSRIESGVSREQARKDLPLSTYTQAYWKIDLHNLLHFLALRMDSHAQFEIREYANAIAKIVSKLVPITWQAFLDYRINAMTLTSLDIQVIKAIMSGSSFEQCQPDSWKENRCRERDECKERLRILGISID